jgi:hypothetical protein
MVDRSPTGSASSGLTVIRWRLDIARSCIDRVAASGPQPDGGYLERAQQTYQSVLEILPRAELNESQRAQVQTELSSLKERLIALGMRLGE